MRPSSLGATQIAVSAVFTLLATISIILRLIARGYAVLEYGVDDGLIIVAWAFAVVYSAIVINVVFWGSGQHMNVIPPSLFAGFLQRIYVSFLFYNLSITFAKLSILSTYLRLFVGHLRLCIVCWITIALITCQGIVILGIDIFQCTPVEYFWNRTIKDGHCLNLVPLWYAQTGINVFHDFVILFAPIPVLIKLNMPRKKKYWVIAVFAMGGLACTVSIIRMAYTSLSSYGDLTYDTVNGIILSNIELAAAVMCGCIACMQQLIRRFFPPLFWPLSDIEGDQELQDYSNQPPGEETHARAERLVNWSDLENKGDLISR